MGDVITTYVNDKEESRNVIWAGKVHTTVRSELTDDEAGYPVRILKDAIADGVPYKDMLITAEHCLFFKGRFVPVRMLVNGVSIFYDKSISSYNYYHVETEQHSVIRADGMLTESYLDTGNRRSFRQDGKVAALRAADTRSWDADAAAPLCVARNFVESLFRTLEARGNQVENCQTPAESLTMTHDADLHLVMANGAVIRPVRRDGQDYSFMLPAGVEAVRIVSRASRPSDVIGPFVDDRRYLGVAVSSVRFLSSKMQNQITTYLNDAGLDGWHAANGQSETIWTNGNALLPLSEQTDGRMGLLIITALPAENYGVDAKQTTAVKKLTA